MRRNKGITLIALVIMIIVLLILATVSIATLTGENGILTQANKAKVETRGASVEEECSLWKINQEIDNKTTEGTAQTLDELLDSLEERNLITAEEKATIKETGEITIGSRTINFGKEDPPVEKPGKPAPETGLFTVSSTIDGNKGTSTNPIIPEGFKPVDEGLAKWGNEKGGPTENAVDEGLVIEDKDGNQFVWVPVKNFNEFKREAGYYNGSPQSGNFELDELTDGEYSEPKGDGIKVDDGATGTEKEVQEMYKSVKDNEGFYIGRYEAGAEEGTYSESTKEWSPTTKVVCKKGAAVYNNIKWGNSMENETGGAVALARGFANQQGYNLNSVKSTLCYGVQWDAVMRWMSDVKNPNAVIADENKKYYIIDSTGMGWYSESGISSPKPTGTDMDSSKNKVKNIYDMAGNVDEWTMEADLTYTRVSRGGGYSNNANKYPASLRSNTYPYTADSTGFRPALYLKIDN